MLLMSFINALSAKAYQKSQTALESVNFFVHFRNWVEQNKFWIFSWLYLLNTEHQHQQWSVNSQIPKFDILKS